jgi:hypothetical protein
VRSAVLLLFAVALTALSPAQRREGVYAISTGPKAAWTINEHHTLVWNGEPYVPAGVAIDGTAAAVERAHAAGVRDVLVDLPANGQGWRETVEALEAKEMRYLIRIHSLAPMAEGFAVEPQAYRVAGIDTRRTVTVDLPDATSAFVVLANRRDSTIASQGRVPIIDGKLAYEANPGPQLEHVLLIYPQTRSLEQPDFWGAMDAQRDSLLSALQRAPFGPGLRGIVNPFGRTLANTPRDLRFVPTNPYFRMELSAFLEGKYKNMQAATRFWGLGTHDLESFEDLARLVPLWSGERGVQQFLDPKTNQIYTGDRINSSAWQDIAVVVNEAAARRYDRVVAAVRSVVDVPVVQEWTGWIPPVEQPRPSVDGVGMRVSGTSPSVIAESGSRAASSLLRWRTRGWLIATDVDLGDAADVAEQIPVVLDDLATLGARGFFVRAESEAAMKAVAAAQKDAGALATISPVAVFYPENATNPAAPQRLPGGRWWLPTPADGNRIDLGSLFFGYRMQEAGQDQIVLWARTPGRYRLRLTDPRRATFEMLDGSDPDVKIVRGAVELNMSQVPMLVRGTSEVPAPEAAFQETVSQFEQVMKAATALSRDITEERLFFNDNIRSYDQNPGGSLMGMRQQVLKAGFKVGDFTWIEAERPADTNFSESARLAGASGGQSLVLRTPLAPGPGGYFATYPLLAKTNEQQEVWIAARIPAERMKDVTVRVNDQVLRIGDEPVGRFGAGFAWYRVGTTRLANGQNTLQVRIENGGSEIAIDVILLSPRPFRPNGAMPPPPIDFTGGL